MRKRNNKFPITLALVVMISVLLSILGLGAQAQKVSSDESGVYTDAILDTADIDLGEADSVIRTEGKGYVALTIVRAFDVEINYCGVEMTVKCSEGTVADALEKAGITLTDKLTVTPDVNTKLTPDCKIDVVSVSGVTITVDNECVEYNTKAKNVREFLDEIGVSLGADDIVTPDLDESICEGMAIIVKRVEYKEETATEVVDYGYVSEETSSLASGTSEIKQYGIEGERTIVTNNMYIDGELAESVVISDEITKEPVDQIKLIGTGKAPSYQTTPSEPSSGGASVENAQGTFTDASGNVVSYTKKLTGTSTAYYAAEGAITATGTPVYVGGVAVNPDVIPYGSKLYIVSSDGRMVYGYATAVDTGGALMSGSVLVDVFYPTYNECINWGRRNVTVYVLS